jgi:hypothetical protein
VSPLFEWTLATGSQYRHSFCKICMWMARDGEGFAFFALTHRLYTYALTHHMAHSTVSPDARVQRLSNCGARSPGALLVLCGSEGFYMRFIFIFNKIWTQDKIDISVGTCVVKIVHFSVPVLAPNQKKHILSPAQVCFLCSYTPTDKIKWNFCFSSYSKSLLSFWKVG